MPTLMMRIQKICAETRRRVPPFRFHRRIHQSPAEVNRPPFALFSNSAQASKSFTTETGTSGRGGSKKSVVAKKDIVQNNVFEKK